MVYKLMPRVYKNKIKEWLRYSGSKTRPERFVNYSFSISIVAGLVAGLLFRQYFAITAPSVFLGVFGLLHGFLMLSMDKRAREVEKILPDALQLMAANSRAGYIPSRALLLSARDEFGPLSDAIKLVGKEIMTGVPLEEALEKMPVYIKSELLERTVKLIIEGTRAGGQFAQLLEENSSDIRNVQVLKKEVNSNILMYTIFIGFAGVIGAPLLYSLSSFLIGTITKLSSSVSVPQAAMRQVPFLKFGATNISPDFLLAFSMAAILITTISGSLIIGLIGTGREKNGIKYIPVMVVAALLVYFLTRLLVNSIFGAFLPS